MKAVVEAPKTPEKQSPVKTPENGVAVTPPEKNKAEKTPEKDAGGSPQSGTPTRTPSSKTRRILVVDDCPLKQQMIRLFCELLTQKETDPNQAVTFVVEKAESGAEGLQKFTESYQPASQPYDVVLMDYHMPGMNGVDTMRNMRKILSTKSPEVPAQIILEYLLPSTGGIHNGAGFGRFLRQLMSTHAAESDSSPYNSPGQSPIRPPRMLGFSDKYISIHRKTTEQLAAEQVAMAKEANLATLAPAAASSGDNAATKAIGTNGAGANPIPLATTVATADKSAIDADPKDGDEVDTDVSVFDDVMPGLPLKLPVLAEKLSAARMS